MLNICLFGAGRIGKLHAGNIAANPRTQLTCVVDVVTEAARSLADAYGAATAPDAASAFKAHDIDAVLIASSTNTHVDLMIAAADAGKAILCEKPIDLDIGRVDTCVAQLAKSGVPAGIGFNRRFDPTMRACRDAIRAGDVGAIEQVIITSRDPGPPPLSYIAVSGGIFRDMTIHDFDLARWLLDDEPVEVFATGSSLVDPEIGKAGDFDSAMVIMRTAKGRLCHINNSRRATYGYDQRIEIFGAKGMVRNDNHRPAAMLRSNATETEAQPPLLDFFLERYRDAYVNELNDFVDAVEAGRQPSVTVEDGRRALLLADAAWESARSGAWAKVPD
ncbi:inositol 2-dehydrogenase [Fodinicurvata sp. EGI_FJ10296]|uniref:inositol 2-dehydrogenase n=1 Tax=Fodinicurvata sp. EGI_FJ10296 TaxID=3231908 RepID=UPI003455B892